MKNNKRNIHLTGALGSLIKSGEINPVNFDSKNDNSTNRKVDSAFSDKIQGFSAQSLFETKSGLQFKVNELISISPKACEPWKYANRLSNEFGNMDELKESIKNEGQQQPILIRPHPSPQGEIKYEVIFGRRRFQACLELDTPLLAIVKNLNDAEAILAQKAENKIREDVSLYSEAISYKRMLEEKVFSSERNMAEALGYSKSVFNELMSLTGIPSEIVLKIPNLKALNVAMAKTILRLLKEHGNCLELMGNLAQYIGESVHSAAQLEKKFFSLLDNPVMTAKFVTKSITVVDSQGKKLFTFRKTSQGAPCIVLNKEARTSLDAEHFIEYVKKYFEEHLDQNLSGYPDSKQEVKDETRFMMENKKGL